MRKQPLQIAAVIALAFTGVVHCGSKTPLGYDDPAASGEKQPTQVKLPTPAPAPPGLRCVAGDLALSRSAPDVMFLIDRSGSMATSFSGSEWGAPKWEVLSNALSGTVGAFDDRISIGATFFPTPSDTHFRDPGVLCKVSDKPDVAPAKGGGADLVDAFGYMAPGGGTPTGAAVDAMAGYFLRAPNHRAHFIVLATDGAPTCNGALDSKTCVCAYEGVGAQGCQTDGYDCLDDDRAVTAVRRSAVEAKVPVYVLGLGNPNRPEFIDTLDRMAVAGGRARAQKPSYYEAKDSRELYESLDAISKSVGRCTFEVASRPDNPDGVVVTIDGREVPRDPTRADGWDWVDRDRGQIAFFGGACDRVAQSEPEVRANVKCDKTR